LDGDDQARWHTNATISRRHDDGCEHGADHDPAGQLERFEDRDEDDRQRH